MTQPMWQSHDSWPQLDVAITGSSGLIGSALAAALETRGARVRRIVRRPPRAASEGVWHPERGTIDAAALEGVNVVVNLAGESLAQRWTPGRKERIRASRVNGTALLARTLASLETRPRLLLSGSAVGIYGDRGSEPLDESSTHGHGFLVSVCEEWEAAAEPARDAGIRVVSLRTGMVLARRGGALPKLMAPIRTGLGGRLGSGEQWVSWIALDDMVAALLFLMRADAPKNAPSSVADLTGPVNFVAPNPVTNGQLTRTLAAVLRRPSLVPVPRAALSLLLGEMGRETVLASQRVRPARLLEAGFDFSYPTLESALRHVLAPAP